MSEPIIQLTDAACSRTNSGEAVLQELNLSIASGEFVGVIGGPGCGKSTLALLLSGVVPHLTLGQVSGSVRIAGMETREHPFHQLVRQAGLVLQHPARQLSGARYSVFEEVAFGLENFGTAREEIRPRVEQALAEVGLEQYADHAPGHLSGGQQQRLMIAALLALAPPILVLDEPTSFLDPQGTAQVFRLLTRLKERGHTVVITSRRLSWLAECADRIIALQRGRIVMDGTPREVLGSDLLPQLGLSSMPCSRVGALLREQGLLRTTAPLPTTVAQTLSELTDADLR